MMRKAAVYRWYDVAQIMDVSRPTAYRMISKLNDELREKGFYTQRGRVSKKYFDPAFIYVGQGCDSTKDRAVIDGAMQMNVIGCANYAEAEEAAKEMVAKGCTAIELCAGFGNEGIARIQRAVGPEIAVGAVKFGFHPAMGFKTGDDVFA